MHCPFNRYSIPNLSFAWHFSLLDNSEKNEEQPVPDQAAYSEEVFDELYVFG